jgi:uncharacterized delta-60 repeat protein
MSKQPRSIPHFAVSLLVLRTQFVRSWLVIFACIAVATALKTNPAYAAPGDLDSTFGTGGKVTTDLGCCGGGANGIAIQTDGKLIAAGASGAGEFALSRYNRDGTLDPTFGTGGIVTTVNGIFDVFRAVTVQADGKIVAAGSSCSPIGGCFQLAIARYNSDGSLDTSFGLGGSVITTYTSSIQAFAVAIESDGKIVAAGGTLSPLASDFILARYSSDGSLDASFGTGGFVTTDLFGGNDRATGLALQKDGKIVAVGVGGPSFDFALARYNADGTLDTTFGSGGLVTTDFGSFQSANGVAIQSDGKIVAAGVGGNQFAVARYNPDGTLDTGFNGTGKATTLFFGQNIETATSLAIQSNGKIVLAGTAFFNFEANFALARFNSDGTLDTSFHGNGQVTTDFGSASDANAVLVQPDGMIVAAGGAGPFTPSDLFALARYEGDPPFLQFGSLSARGEIRTSSSEPGFEVTGTFTLGAGSTGIAPDTQAVSLVFGKFSSTIPAGSFKKNKNGRYAFEGTVNGADIEFSIAPAGVGSFAFHVEASGVSLAGTTNPASLELLIGSNGGTTQVIAEID